MLSEMMIDLLRFLIKSRGIVNKRCCQSDFILDDIISGMLSGNFYYGYRSNQIVTKVVFRQISHKKKKSVDDVSTDFELTTCRQFGHGQ